MNSAAPDNDIDSRIVDAAAEWFVEFNTGEPDAPTRRRFDAWLRKSPEHLRAYLEMFPLWGDAERVDSEREFTADELVQLARGSGTVVAMEGHAAAGAPPVVATQRKSGAWRVSLAASIVAVVGAAAIWFHAQFDSYTTGIGEQRILALADGSSVELNARSRLKVNFMKTGRNIELLEGQALFRVAKDAVRPFIVISGGARVRAVGTQFDVHKKITGVTVTVLEGRVAVSSLPSARRGEGPGEVGLNSSLLSAGDQAVITAAAIKRPRTPDVQAATAWRQHRLVFSATPVQEVAEEFNRYNEKQIVIRNNSGSPFEVSGAFSMTDLPSLLSFLRAQPNVLIEEDSRQISVTINR